MSIQQAGHEPDGGRLRTVAVVGLGYIGLPTAAMFAASGKQVVGIDISQRAVDAVNAGKPHIEEGDLDALVERCVASGHLRATTEPVPADAFVIAVPTPVGAAPGHQPDVSYVEAAGRSIAPVLKRGDLIILESTSPVGTTERLSRLLAEARPDLRFPHQAGAQPDIHLAYCPERIIPGNMLRELVENDRIIGGMTADCTALATGLYQAFVRGQCLAADAKTAEMVKLTENAFRDVNIAFANELSMVCGDAGVDAWEVIALANRHPRVNILRPGPGVGGHCIAVDPWFIVAQAPERARLMRTAREVNDAKPHYVLDQARALLDADPEATLVCLGLSYKPDVDDFRESPSLEIACMLTDEYPGRILCSDPYAEALDGAVVAAHSLQIRPHSEAIAAASIVLVLVGHTAFRVHPRPDGKQLLDAAGFWV
ncbi:UDP-N-acetyl-D-mannosamine dehydrogenase [Luteimonas sp. M1R5S18]|uniref:UDP-N-acetyl-D-mannosamine dehydrogenase n=1 Tax=Luteimonas rhizosphaericola TaxID=3042024 RepID=A0ABT6JMR8_9GAMM|nr:UDP-N-acetyl-D-mannosamine dehydrogenase [Luteimonas rhizosphaericola]MDH5831822.1 UDP-N-acetyl-D-mannosamine dehydrogenase [Luteimonas rhizosphaericola]